MIADLQPANSDSVENGSDRPAALEMILPDSAAGIIDGPVDDLGMVGHDQNRLSGQILNL